MLAKTNYTYKLVVQIKLQLIENLSLVSKTWVNWLNDKKINEFSDKSFKKHTINSQLKFVKNKLKLKSCKIYAIFFRKKHIGCVELSNISTTHKTVEVKILIGEENLYRKGIGSQVLKKIKKIVFEDLKMNKLKSSVVSGNIKSINFFLKNGFIKEAELKNEFKFDGVSYNKIYFSIFANNQA